MIMFEICQVPIEVSVSAPSAVGMCPLYPQHFRERSFSLNCGYGRNDELVRKAYYSQHLRTEFMAIWGSEVFFPVFLFVMASLKCQLDTDFE